MYQDTIAAISTPLGESGIGIVRLSGNDARSIADRIFTGKLSIIMVAESSKQTKKTQSGI
jgi:tRNA U34 5-carboxymethylaminomethyl modifying GTPase MnmE/TrmE